MGSGIAHLCAQAGAVNLLFAARLSSAPELAAVEQSLKYINPSVSTKCLAVDIHPNESVTQLARVIWNEFERRNVVLTQVVVLKVDEGNPQNFQDNRYRRVRHISLCTPLYSLAGGE
jgi:hypothetical protein